MDSAVSAQRASSFGDGFSEIGEALPVSVSESGSRLGYAVE